MLMYFSIAISQNPTLAVITEGKVSSSASCGHVLVYGSSVELMKGIR